MQVDENMRLGQRQDAVLKERFWFRQDILSRDCDEGDDSTQMTIDEIINGKVRGEGAFLPDSVVLVEC